MKKYELTTGTQTIKTDKAEILVYRIKALVDIPGVGVKAGDLGGFILNEDCLSQTGNCWVFSDAVVTHDVFITENALVRGASLLRNGVTLKGECEVIDSHLAHNIAIEGTAKIVNSSLRFNCAIKKSVEVTDSKICSLHMEKGRITRSTIMVKNKKILEIKGKTVFIDADLEIRGDRLAKIERGGHFEKVKAKKLTCFSFYQHGTVINAEFFGETALHFGVDLNPSEEKSVIWGGHRKLKLENVDLRLKNTNIKNGVSLKGAINLFDCDLNDMAEVVNETSSRLTLRKVKMDEVASVLKTDDIPTTLENVWLTMDNQYTC